MAIHLVYKISAFGDFRDIVPAHETMTSLLEIFKEYEMIPTLFNEFMLPVSAMPIAKKDALKQPAQQSQLRIALTTNDGLEQIFIESSRIDYEIRSNESVEMDDASASQNNERIAEIFGLLFDKYKKRASRLAFFTQSIIVDFTNEEIALFLKKFSNPVSIYSESPLYEWSTRLVTRQDVQVEGMSETINVITDIIKAQVVRTDQAMLVTADVDGIQIGIDINTIPEVSTSRFSAKGINEFSFNALNLWNKIWSEMK